MFNDYTIILLYTKYLISFILIFIIIMLPAWLARQTKKTNYEMLKIRLASWIFGWTIIGWLWALFYSIKK